MTIVDTVWREQDTTPDAIVGALARLLQERHVEDAGAVPARVLNLISVVDAEWSGEVANRLRGVGRYHASRTVVCAVRHGHDRLDAAVSITADAHHDPHTPVALRELVIVTCGERHLPYLDTIVDPLVVTDLATVLWTPHGHDEVIEVLLPLAQVVLRDSVDDPDVGRALRRACELTRQAYVVDLAWLRSTPWRERVAASFDPPHLRTELTDVTAVTIRHHPESGAAALLLAGWLASRLGWTPSALRADGSALVGDAASGERTVALRLEPDSEQTIRGLAGVTVETASRRALALDRGPGGLQARARHADGHECEWTILGASRGESGILGEGIRQALLRDPTYAPALAAATELAP